MSEPESRQRISFEIPAEHAEEIVAVLGQFAADKSFELDIRSEETTDRVSFQEFDSQLEGTQQSLLSELEDELIHIGLGGDSKLTGYLIDRPDDLWPYYDKHEFGSMSARLFGPNAVDYPMVDLDDQKKLLREVDYTFWQGVRALPPMDRTALYLRLSHDKGYRFSTFAGPETIVNTIQPIFNIGRSLACQLFNLPQDYLNQVDKVALELMHRRYRLDVASKVSYVKFDEWFGRVLHFDKLNDPDIKQATLDSLLLLHVKFGDKLKYSQMAYYAALETGCSEKVMGHL